MIKHTCPESGTAIGYSNQYKQSIKKGFKGSLYSDSNHNRHAFCAFCGKDVRITTAGFGGAWGSIPRHNSIRNL